MIRLTKRYRFSASHRLHCDALSETENQQIFGKCNHPFGHGHDYVLDVTVEGPVNEPSGQVVCLDQLNRLVEDRILRHFDSRNLNMDVPEFAALIPTTENLARVVERRLCEGWLSSFGEAPLRLQNLRLEETKRNRIELRNEHE